MNTQPHPLVYIEWCDAMINTNSWLSIEEAVEWAENKHWIVSEVGFLLKETKEYILLSNKKNLYDKDNTEVGGIIKIPTTWIKKRIDLTAHVQ